MKIEQMHTACFNLLVHRCAFDLNLPISTLHIRIHECTASWIHRNYWQLSLHGFLDQQLLHTKNAWYVHNIHAYLCRWNHLMERYVMCLFRNAIRLYTNIQFLSSCFRGQISEYSSAFRGWAKSNVESYPSLKQIPQLPSSGRVCESYTGPENGKCNVCRNDK
jgi:hypothetical protein